MWRILGPVEVTVAGRVLGIRRPQQRAVLALLLLNADHVVPADQLATALWGDFPPRSARTQVQVCISRIRAVLRDAGLPPALSSHAGGYRLRPGPGTVDLSEFTMLVRRARTSADAGRLAAAADDLRTGLALWRGPALGGATGAFVEPAAASLAEQRLSAYEQLADVELALGRQDRVVGMLRPLVDAHPLRERLVGRLMLALAGCGQQSEALGLFVETRSRLAQELGLAPTAELADAQLRVLRGQVSVRADVRPPHRATAPVVPAQLPADIAGFTGRNAALQELGALLPGAGSAEPAATVVISAIGGTAGVGKTTLAVHWGHRVAHRFPDGQLYVNLRGFDLDGRVMAAGTALRGFLDALGVAPQRVPTDQDQQAALYRSLLAGRRVLILLDNARDAPQVRPLLPGAPGCLVVVTSRHALVSLVATEGARLLTLDVLSTAEARALLARRLGPERVAAEEHAVAEVISRCARLPLALAILAARAASRPDFGLATLAAELADSGDRLGALNAGDPATDIRAVLYSSYRTLNAAAGRLFRLLGLHPGPDAAVAAIASLAGAAPADIRPLLDSLTGAHLLSERTPGRYSFHDLLRAYAAELCRTVDSDAERDAARGRLYDHYLHTASTADLLIDPYRLARPMELPKPLPGTLVEQHADHTQAMRWLVAEHQALLAIVRQAADTGHHSHAWRLAGALVTFLDRRGHWDGLADTQRIALASARYQGHRLGQAQAHRGLAIVHTWLGRYEAAEEHYAQGLGLHGELGDDAGRANTHLGISWVLARQGRYREALDHTERAHALFLGVGSRAGRAKALNNSGVMHARLGNHDQALVCCEQALALHTENGDRHGAALTWDSLGYAYHCLGRHDRAIACYGSALALHRTLGDRYDEGEVLTHLGDAHDALGDDAAAWAAWRQALGIYDEIRHPDADQLRARLATPADAGDL